MPITRTEVLAVVILMTFFILVMVTFIIIILFFLQKKQRGFSQDLMAAKANYERELFKAQLEIQEQTFQEIAREIHDNAGQVLSLAKLGLGTFDLERKDELQESIIETSDLIEIALDDLRHMSRSMNTQIIKKGGLKKSIEMQVGYIQRGGKFNIHFTVNGDQVSLDETKEIFLFRIVQEAVNNIIRHAKASDICISLCYENEQLIMRIKDNGIGFNLNEQISGTGQISGIYNMQHRANLIGADYQMESNLGIGTCITVKTPF
jgi:two-component system, NarL family, sensor kinase